MIHSAFRADAEEGDAGCLFLHRAKTRFEVKAQQRDGRNVELRRCSHPEIYMHRFIIHVAQMQRIRKCTVRTFFIGFDRLLAAWLK